MFLRHCIHFMTTWWEIIFFYITLVGFDVSVRCYTSKDDGHLSMFRNGRMWSKGNLIFYSGCYLRYMLENNSGRWGGIVYELKVNVPINYQSRDYNKIIWYNLMTAKNLYNIFLGGLFTLRYIATVRMIFYKVTIR